jgi:hypothetical protein
MTPKEKARELLDKFLDITPVDYSHDDTVEQTNQKAIADFKLCKQCALIAMEEAEKSEYNVLTKFGFVAPNYTSDYWQSVKSEIEKL